MIVISGFSGKCDICDHYGDYTDDELKNIRFYVGRNPVPLRIDSQHDLAPYYPYLVCIASYNGGKGSCKMSEESFIDFEEAERLSWTLRDLKKYRRKCKRNGIPYDVEEAAKAVSLFRSELPYTKELAKRVGEYGDKADIDGVHDDIHEYYRNRLFDEMVRLGWKEAVADYWIWNDFSRLGKYLKKEETDG